MSSSAGCLCNQSVVCPRTSPPNLGTSCFQDKSLNFLRDPRGFIQKQISEYGSRVFVCRILMRPCFIVSSNKDIKDFLNNRKNHEKSYNGLRDYFFGLFGDSLLLTTSMNDADHFRQILLPLMEPETLIKGQYCDQIDDFCDQWMKDHLVGPVVVYNEFKQFSSELVMTLFLGLKDEDAKEMSKLATEHWHGIISLPVNFRWSVMSSGYRRAMEAKAKMLEIIEERIKSKGSSFLERASQKMELEVLKNHVLVFTSALIPKALASIFSSFINSSKVWWEFVHDDKDGLISEKKLKAVFMEILRFYPPFLGGLKAVSDQDLVLGDYHVPKGYGLLYASFVAHRDPDVFPDPDNFDPGRWISVNAGDYDKVFGFGSGPHSCIGQKLMWDIMVRVGKALILNYRWTPPQEFPFEVKMLPVSRPLNLDPIELKRIV